MSNLRSGRMATDTTVKGSACKIPSEPGVYRHVNSSTNQVEYVGQTDNLRKRQQEHVRNGKLDLDSSKVMWSGITNGSKDDLCRIEREHIQRHNPNFGKQKKGRLPKCL